ncbi:phenoloxidase-activating factor 3-like [Cloeon dipterum]|uniref:phenoloxidase-activating factor 3-like n=1 Tax=Cloeon dipterum TaxID=197152 RepID=UPI00321FB6AB
MKVAEIAFLFTVFAVQQAFTQKVILEWNQYEPKSVECSSGLRCMGFQNCLRYIGYAVHGQAQSKTSSALRRKYSIGNHFSPATTSKHLLRHPCRGHKRVCCPAFYKIVTSYVWKNNSTHAAITDGKGTENRVGNENDTQVADEKSRRQAVRKMLQENCAQPLTVRASFGEIVKAGELPWLAMLRFADNGALRFSCGGTLISDRYVLTAAHCAKPRKKSMTLVSARLGELNLSSNCDEVAAPDDLINIIYGPLRPKCAAEPLDVDVEEVIVHPEYKYDFVEGFPNDVALIRLKEKVKSSMFVRPICLRGLQSLGAEQEQQGTVKVAGWGMTEMEQGPKSNELRQVPVKRVPRHICRDEHRVMVRDTCQKCAGSRNGSACMGDSGGPLLLQTQLNMTSLVGVVSFGAVDCGTSDVPSVFSDLSCYLDWIIDTIRLE